MERELTRRCRHNVRVAEFVALHAISTLQTGSNTKASLDHNLPLFSGYVEILYARTAWLAVRIDIWMHKDACYRQVKSLSVYMHQNEDERKVAVTSGSKLIALQEKEQIALCTENRGEVPVLTSDELTRMLENVIMQLIIAFRDAQVQVLETLASQRAKFEFEILQHYTDLELLVLSSCEDTGDFVLFALPVFEEKLQWDTEFLCKTKKIFDMVYIPNGFRSPNFSESTHNVTLFIGYPIDEESGSSDAWPLFIEWPARMVLSSQVTQTPPSSKTQSSVEVITSCQKITLHQWRRRKDFIAEMRRHVIVLEYDAVDFSQVFFMLQEQRNEQAPLRIIVLRLQFTVAYLFTNCMSDLQVTLLDGQAGDNPVTIALGASSTSLDPDSNIDSQLCVVQFLELIRQNLLKKFDLD